MSVITQGYGSGSILLQGYAAGAGLPLLVVVDNQDTTGATATISATANGANNTVFVYSLATGHWSPGGSRTGNGSLSLNVPPGSYLAYVSSVVGSSTKTSAPTNFAVGEVVAPRHRSYLSHLFKNFGLPCTSAYIGQTIVGYVAGNRAHSVEITGALVDLSFEPGTNEAPGDGSITRDASGDRERRTGKLSIPKDKVSSLGIKESWSFWIDGELWFIQRRDAKDNAGGAYTDFRITNVNPLKSRHPNIEPSRPVRSR